MYSVRMRCGRKLAKEAPVEADIVSTVPESATPAALGYSEMVSNESSSLNLRFRRLFSFGEQLIHLSN